jgi:hypothetical protein
VGANKAAVAKVVNSTAILITSIDQAHDHGAAFYDESRQSEDELSFDEVFRAVWQSVFIPSPAVAALSDQRSKDLNLVPGKYVSTQVRSKYHRDRSNDIKMIDNSLNCASNLEPGWSIYFTSDSTNATVHAINYGRSRNATVVSGIAEKEPLHLDRGNEFLKLSDGSRNNTPAGFYTVFVDLYLLANSRCVSYGLGGFGKWGSLLSHNRTCSVRHSISQCDWVEAH